jgi:hypothetical protein
MNRSKPVRQAITRAVVGAGPSGLFAASELARHGVEVRRWAGDVSASGRYRIDRKSIGSLARFHPKDRKSDPMSKAQIFGILSYLGVFATWRESSCPSDSS